MNYPRQSERVGKPVEVCFNLNSSKTIQGTLVRDDLEEPYVKIIRLVNEQYVMPGECQWRPL